MNNKFWPDSFFLNGSKVLPLFKPKLVQSEALFLSSTKDKYISICFLLKFVNTFMHIASFAYSICMTKTPKALVMVTVFSFLCLILLAKFLLFASLPYFQLFSI